MVLSDMTKNSWLLDARQESCGMFFFFRLHATNNKAIEDISLVEMFI